MLAHGTDHEESPGLALPVAVTGRLPGGRLDWSLEVSRSSPTLGPVGMSGPEGGSGGAST